MEQKNLIINSSYISGEKSKEVFPIYLENNLFFGKTNESEYNVGIIGTIEDKKIKILKIPEIWQYTPILWQGIVCIENAFQGHFDYFRKLEFDSQKYYSSIENTIKELKNNNLYLDENTRNIVNIIRKEKYENPNIGNCLIELL